MNSTLSFPNSHFSHTSPLQNVLMETENGAFDHDLTYRYVYGLQKVETVIYGIIDTGEGNSQGEPPLHLHLPQRPGRCDETLLPPGQIGQHSNANKQHRRESEELCCL